MLIDWLTLRHPLGTFGDHLAAKIRDNIGHICQISPDGEVMWQKPTVDWDSIRSDSLGLFWSITGGNDDNGAPTYFLTIGGSPSSAANLGINVFGSLDISEGAKTLLETASKALNAILPHHSKWQCRRIDVTANYDMGNSAQVKQALRNLLSTDAPRRRTNSDKRGGDTVYWNPSSDLRAGKAYHKGAHLRYQQKLGNIAATDEQLDLADNLIRLELKLGSRWLRRLSKAWHTLTQQDLAAEHESFFSSLLGCGDLEVYDMGTLLKKLEQIAPTPGRALSAHRTWALIKTIGYTQTRESMSKGTFDNHCVWLRAAGISSAALCSGDKPSIVLEFKKRVLVLNAPVLSWAEIKRAA